MMKSLRTTLSIVLLLLTLPIYADEIFEKSSHIDWTEGTMYLELRFSPPGGSGLHPSVRQQAVAAARRELPSIFIEEIGRINIDSRTDVREKLLSSPELINRVRELALSGEIRSAGFNRDFSTFTQVFAFPVYPDIADLFITHPRAVPQMPVLEYVPGGNYTGIVIFVENPLPLYGTNRAETLQPALFPRIHSPEMECIFDRFMVDPEKIRQHGMLRYYPDTRIGEIYSRVGEVPLYVHASGVFGINFTDLIFPERAARRIRADEHTLSLLRDGRVAVVYTSD